jgi:hypothetical protein
MRIVYHALRKVGEARLASTLWARYALWAEN